MEAAASSGTQSGAMMVGGIHDNENMPRICRVFVPVRTLKQNGDANFIDPHEWHLMLFLVDY